MKNFLVLIVKGIFVGVANIIPGVSGGTIAVVLGIFDELIDAINNFFRNPKKHIAFLVPLVIGAMLGIVLLSKAIKFGLETFSLPTNMFFAGLVIGSIPLIYGKARTNIVKTKHYLSAIVAFGFVLVFVFLEKFSNDNSVVENVASAVSFGFLIKMFVGAIIASSAMVIPGISGSFIMVLLGMYNTIIGSISDFIDEITVSLRLLSESGIGNAVVSLINSDSFKILVAVGIGVVLGVIVISKIISILLEKAYTTTYFCVLGLIFGSLISIFISPETYQSGTGIGMIASGVVTLVLGFIIAFKLGNE